MATKKEETALSVLESHRFELATLPDDMKQIIAEEMDGLGTIPFDTIKIPSGGGLVFEVPTDDPDNPDSEKEITGIIVDHFPINAYWRDSFDGQNNPPECSSSDGHVGIDAETGELKNCATCPYNQFGSGSDQRGKACKNMHAVYILMSGRPIPVLLTLPPTSLGNLRTYIAKSIVLKGLRSHNVLTKVTLQKAVSAGGVKYSKATFAVEAVIPQSERDGLEPMIDSFKAMIQTMKNDIPVVPSFEGEPAAERPARRSESGDGFVSNGVPFDADKEAAAFMEASSGQADFMNAPEAEL